MPLRGEGSCGGGGAPRDTTGSGALELLRYRGNISCKEKKHKMTKWLSEEALQIAKKRREVKGKGDRERYTQLNAEFQYSGRWVIEDPAVMYVRECFAYVLL